VQGSVTETGARETKDKTSGGPLIQERGEDLGKGAELGNPWLPFQWRDMPSGRSPWRLGEKNKGSTASIQIGNEGMYNTDGSKVDGNGATIWSQIFREGREVY